MATSDTNRMQHQPAKTRRYKCSVEEMQIFNQCHKERLTHQRVAATGLASLAFITVESGYLKAGRKGGPWPHVVCAIAAGYYIGKYWSFFRGKSEWHQLKALRYSYLGEALRQQKFNTPGNLKFMKEWAQETLNTRCLPISSVLGTLSYAAIKSGYLRAGKKQGPWPTVCMAVIAGCFIGVDWNLKKGYDKLMTQPHNPIAEAIRMQTQKPVKKKTPASAVKPVIRVPRGSLSFDAPGVSDIGIPLTLNGNYWRSSSTFTSSKKHADGFYRTVAYGNAEWQLELQYEIQRHENYKRFLLSDIAYDSTTPPLLESCRSEEAQRIKGAIHRRDWTYCTNIESETAKS